MSAPTIVAAGLTHCALLATLHAACFAEPDDERWNADAFAGLLGPAGGSALLALDAANSPCGLAVARVLFDEAELLTIGTLPANRGQGVGAALLTAVEARARAAGASRLLLEVAEDNAAARGLYRTRGFIAIGRRPGYYRGGRVAALVMELTLGRVPGAVE